MSESGEKDELNENQEEFSEEDKDEEYIPPSAAKGKKKPKKPKVISEWSDDNVFKLIACVLYIRIQFRSYANEKTKSGDAAAPPINWKFYSAMQFIGHAECEQTATTESNLVSISSILFGFIL